jgi:hypothetical protein
MEEEGRELSPTCPQFVYPGAQLWNWGGMKNTQACECRKKCYYYYFFCFFYSYVHTMIGSFLPPFPCLLPFPPPTNINTNEKSDFST